MRRCLLILLLVGRLINLGCLAFRSPSVFVTRQPNTMLPNGAATLWPRSSTNGSGLVANKSNSHLCMSSDDSGGGGIQGILFSLLGAVILILFVATSFLPLMGGGGDRDLSIADSVVTRQDAPGKLANYESKGDRLSRSSIQEKLNTVPVFYLVNNDNVMSTDIFMSYQDAKGVADAKSFTVKATTLDQVT